MTTPKIQKQSWIPENTEDPRSSKPSVFIGSSTEGLPVAKQLQQSLALVAKCRIWTQGVFGLGEVTLESLVEATREHDFAILVLTPDDLTTKRGQRKSIPRDNVVFEIGLFMGALGRERTFIVYSHDRGIELPSDLAGVTTATFSGENDDLEVALGGACAKLEQAIVRIPANIRDLAGQWHSRYQNHDTPIGEWMADTVEVQAKPGSKLSIKNYEDPVGLQYEAVGEFRGKDEIVGLWRDTRPATSVTGTFHLYVDPFGSKLYGICTGQSGMGERIYSGWILAREFEKLDDAKRKLTRAILLSGEYPKFYV